MAEELAYQTVNHSQSVAIRSVKMRAAEPVQCDETTNFHKYADH